MIIDCQFYYMLILNKFKKVVYVILYNVWRIADV